MWFLLTVAVLQASAGIQFACQGQRLKAILLLLYAVTNVVLAFLEEAH